MTWLPCRVTRAVCLAFAVATAGACSRATPLPLPDAGRVAGLNLSASPQSLVIRPGSSGRLRFVVRDEQNQPVAGYPLSFSITGNDSADGSTRADLSTPYALTDGEGGAVVEVLVGELGLYNRPAAFVLQASCPGSPAYQADVLVTTNPNSVEIVPVGDGFASTKLLFYDTATCAQLDLTNLSKAGVQPRIPTQPVAAGASYLLQGVAGVGNSAVVGLGQDSAGHIVVAGCLDIPGQALIESVTMRATLFLDQFFPSPLGTFIATSDFQTTSAQRLPLAAARAAWQEWARCPLDPARLWLDCAIDALSSDPDADPNDCIPAASEGTLGDQLMAHRGRVVPPLADTLASPTATPCHDATDASGAPSAESVVNDLFRNAQTSMATANLGNFPAEIAAILNNFRIESALTLAPGSDPNTFLVSHQLVRLSFPFGLVPFSVDASLLGLPIAKATGIVATFKNGQLTLPSHAFTLRLGTTARYAFESTSLRSRGVANSSAFVNQIAALARLSDPGDARNACEAFDVAVSRLVGVAVGSFRSACQTGLSSLAHKLADAFADLDGAGLDFRLAGSAPVIDNTNDGLADALGQQRGERPAPLASPGVWSAQIDSRGGGYSILGSWTASYIGTSP